MLVLMLEIEVDSETYYIGLGLGSKHCINNHTASS